MTSAASEGKQSIELSLMIANDFKVDQKWRLVAMIKEYSGTFTSRRKLIHES